MKAIYKNTALGIFLTIFAVAAPTAFAQDVCKDVDANTALYKKYTDNYAGNLEQVKVAVAAAEEYIQKYEACKDEKGAATYAEQVNYFKGALPERKKFVADTEKATADKALFARFNAAAQSKNVAEIYASGKEIIAKYPDNIDVIITMANAGFDEVLAKPTATTYNNDVINYAKSAIQKIEGGTTSKNYGAFTYALQNKENALGVLNYTVATVLINDSGRKKEAVPYFYKTTQHEAKIKSNPFVYQAIGANYLDEILALDKKRTDIIKANGDKDTPESLAVEAMQKGYAERAIDAYARAYKFAKADKNQKKEYVDSLSTRVKELYASRYTGKTLDNVDTYVTTVTTKTLVDPTTTVTPVVEEAPATAPTTPATTAPANNTTTKPATTPTKPVSSTATTPAAATTNAGETATAKPKAAKKPAPKKKGTR